ncbi:MAG TPA: hypothetical protein PLQ11_05545 [Beijerinckiaceae bacterium]|nr:hypothetical protein [Beijerinckiaceae bacterium]
MKRVLAVGFAMVWAASGGAHAEPLTPVYSSIQNCTPLPRLELPGRTIVRTEATAAARCRGVGGFDLAVVEEDTRSWLAVIAPGGVHPLNRAMVQEFRHGHFPTITDNKVVEWRVDGQGQPRALIVRVHFTDPDMPATSPAARKSLLMVFDLRALPPRLAGTAPDNAGARRVADGE